MRLSERMMMMVLIQLHMSPSTTLNAELSACAPTAICTSHSYLFLLNGQDLLLRFLHRLLAANDGNDIALRLVLWQFNSTAGLITDLQQQTDHNDKEFNVEQNSTNMNPFQLTKDVCLSCSFVSRPYVLFSKSNPRIVFALV